MPQLLSGGGSQSASGLILQPYEGGAGVNSGGNSSSSSRASSTGSSSAGRFRAVVSISSDDDRDRIFYEEGNINNNCISHSFPHIQGNIGQVRGEGGFYYNSAKPPPGKIRENSPVDTEPYPGASRPLTGGPPPPPPKPPAKPPARRASGEGVDCAMAATTLGMPEASRWCGPDGSVPKVVAHENGAIVNGYLLVNGTDNLDVTMVENQAEYGAGATKRFHVTGMMTNGNRPKEQLGNQVVVESTFAGSRDVMNPDPLRDLKIVSSKGTIRGVKNRVRAGIATFLENQDTAKNYRGAEKGKIVIYVTSMRIIRDTNERCQKARRILQTHMVCYEEVDIFMSKENQRHLMERLGTDEVIVPQVFADGQHLGGLEELDYMNENGELRQIFQNFKKVQHTSSCTKCGGYRFVNCPSCHGSKKSLNRNHFTEEFCALRCVNCDENGLVRCDNCTDQDPDNI